MESQKGIYRFINFFDLYNMLEHGKMRLTQLKVFEDKNEGFGSILRNLELGELIATNREQLIEDYKVLKNTTYTSCWSMEPDSVAMWALYSRDMCGFRIKSTDTKLLTVNDRFDLNNDMIPEEFGLSKCKNMVVNYIDLKEMINEIEIKNKKIVERLNQVSLNLDSSERIRTDYTILSEELSQLLISDDSISYKDKAYDFEREFRSIVELDVLDEEMYDDLYSGHYDFSELPKFIYLKIPENFIENICIDPRCPIFKKRVYLELIDKYKIPSVESEVFGTMMI